ncbi:succinyl-diaminopimelate desuccinylase domain protein [Mycobacteroides abscessus MAB_082312_2258]|nr:succinyl-diaminopimelate desuccinylase domain protein [Mycobacteroides abscessus MAB_082312_2258]
MHVHERLLGAAIGSEPEVHGDRRRIGNHVPGDSAIDPYRGQSFPILTAVDIDDARLVRGQPVQYSSQFVNGVVPQPGSRRVRAGAPGPDDDPQGALTARFDESGGRLAQDGQVGVEPVGQFAFDAAQPVGRGLDLLAVVEHQRKVHPGCHGGGQMQEYGVPGFHVDGAAAVQDLSLVPAGHVIGGGHGIQVPGQHDPGTESVIRTGQHRVAVADDLETTGLFPQRHLDRIGDLGLVTGLTGDVYQGSRQGDRVTSEFKRHRFRLACTP